MNRSLSPTMKSCLFTKALTAKSSAAQEIGKPYAIPAMAARQLCAQLILEEAMETVRALGVSVVYWDKGQALQLDRLHFRCEDGITFAAAPIDGPPKELKKRLFDIVDGACDTIYVATGVLAACGVPDLPHLQEVCRANDSKFPGGRVITGAGGKYLKPAGWKGPDHAAVMKKHKRSTNLKTTAAVLTRKGKSTR